MRRFVVHSFPQYPCNYPHESFVGDYKELVRRDPTDEDLNVFINSHTPDFLRQLISKIPPLLALLLRQDPARFHSARSMLSRTFHLHFADLRGIKRPLLVVDNTR